MNLTFYLQNFVYETNALNSNKKRFKLAPNMGEDTKQITL